MFAEDTRVAQHDQRDSSFLYRGGRKFSRSCEAEPIYSTAGESAYGDAINSLSSAASCATEARASSSSVQLVSPDSHSPTTRPHDGGLLLLHI